MNPLELLIQRALEEDDVTADVTTALLGLRQRTTAQAVLKAKRPGVFSGREYVESFARVWGGGLKLETSVTEGTQLAANDVIVKIAGPAGEILRAERTLINGLALSCGVATLTAEFVSRVGNLPTTILATRKTLPGLRPLQLPAVVAGGGRIHRRSLSDGILIKENHQAWGTEAEIVGLAKASRSPLHRIEIEIQDFAGLERALAARPDIILIDNFNLADLAKAVRIVNEQCETEASGGVTLELVRAIAETGVNYVSVGALTHSAKALDISLDFVERL